MRRSGPCPWGALGALSLALTLPATHALADPAAAAPATEATAAKRVSIDRETGQIRPVERDDLRTVTPAAAATAYSAAAAAPARGSAMSRLKTGEFVTATGVRGMRMGVEHLNFTRVTRQADGSLTTTCQVGESAETHAQHSAATPAPVSLVRRPAMAMQGARDVE
jgi:hypothetical protein